jgi:hypothetical protein
MTPVKLHVATPAPVQVPRGAVWAASAALAVLQAADAAWHALFGPRHDDHAPRSADALHRLAGQVERDQPSLAWEVRAIARHLRTFETTPASGHSPTGGTR